MNLLKNHYLNLVIAVALTFVPNASVFAATTEPDNVIISVFMKLINFSKNNPLDSAFILLCICAVLYLYSHDNLTILIWSVIICLITTLIIQLVC
jgi:hypothetical protein